MRLSEMQNKKSGLPAGFEGVRTKWDEVRENFRISKAAILQRPAINEKGEVLTYAQGPRAGQPIPDRQIVLAIETVSGKRLVVRSNSRRLTSLYSGDLDREPDGENSFGDEIFFVEAPEGVLRFVAFKQEYKDGKKGDVADLEEVDE